MESLNAEWRLRAKCRGHAEPDLWFPHHRTDGAAQRAIFICRSKCPVRRECGEAAADGHERHAIVAGFFAANAEDWRALHRWLGRPVPGTTASGGFREITCADCGRTFGSWRAATKCPNCQQGLVPAGPVWQQIEVLRKRFSCKEISQRAGLHDAKAVFAIRTQTWVRQDTAARIAALVEDVQGAA
ncbi:WhiB family transcriptional regulator [Nocardia sp. N2S4-5]|uniref:WhiB family transcriptional regulator n=1 Tax=Nocardia sp. N2S4-5 TaxID=3351565 RepID=UPI0037D2D1D8